MRLAPRSLLLAGFFAGSLVLGALPCATSPSTVPNASQGVSEVGRQDATQRHWDQVKRLIERRAYREALEELSIILTMMPHDARAIAYRRLCESRLRAARQFVALSPEKLEALTESLTQEQHAQVREAVQMKALQREIANEQAKWDAELKRVERHVIRERKALGDRARLEETRRRRAMQEKIHELARLRQAKQVAAAVPRAPTTPAPPPPAPAPPATPGGRVGEAPPRPAVPPPPTPAPSLPPAPTPTPSVELQPVVVPMRRPEQPPEVAVTPPPPQPPTLPPVRPPGAVQIFADHMEVSPERRLAMAQGDVRIVFENGVLTCDKVSLFTDTKDVYAQGHVRLERGKEVYHGELVHYNINTKKGRFLEGSAYREPWHEYGRVVEHLAEGVLRLRPGYVTTCEFDPPHYRFQGRAATVFADDKIVRGRHVTLAVEEFPLIYLPWLSLADRQTPFFLIPGKNKIWEQFALMGYRYEWPAGHQGTLRLDWRRAFGWGVGVTDRVESERLGKGLLKLYYNEERNMRRPKEEVPKGASLKRYRALWRHVWEPLAGTTMVTDIQKFSDVDFRREFLFREEFIDQIDPEPEVGGGGGFISTVTNDPNFTVKLLATKRMNRFETVTEAFPDATVEVRPVPIGDTQLFIASSANVANLQTKRAHSDNDTDVVRVDWLQKLSYGLNLFRPILLTPNMAIRQTYYTKDIQGSNREGKRDLISGQFSGGLDASLKLFRIFPVTTNALGLHINQLRHVLTPTLAYSYVHQPTVPNTLLDFAMASSTTNALTFGLENKLQTRRPKSPEAGQKQDKPKFRGVDIARFFISAPYTFRGNGNKQGGRLGDWKFDLELYPWSWMRLETNWGYPSHFVKGSRDSRVTSWNVDLVMIGGRGGPLAQEARDLAIPARRFRPGPQLTEGFPLLPQGQWYLGLRHGFSHNDKTEDLIQFDWRLSEKWQIGTFHRFTWKETAGGVKRFNNVRELQYTLTRDLHDWIAELVYRVDREFGEELFLTLTLKAYPELPIDLSTSYHQPKLGSQSSRF